jgi:hypothetical protein
VKLEMLVYNNALWSFSNSICGGTRNCSFEDLIFVFEASVTFKNSYKRNAHNS